jgi:T5orf172 domain
MDDKKKLFDIFKDDSLGILDVRPLSSPAKDERERLRDSYLDILDFYKENKREPLLGNGVQETSLYFRLKGIRENADKKASLSEYDKHGLLLKPVEKEIKTIDDIFKNDILGILDTEAESIFTLKHVPKMTSMPDYIGSRKPCKDFDNFEHLFKECQSDLASRKRKIYPFKNEQQIKKGHFFVLKGILLYVASVGKRTPEKGKYNARLRCIFENGTESDMLLRSLAAELYKNGRRVTEQDDKLLDGLKDISAEDEETGFIYVLRSKSSDQKIASIENLYKIGFSKVPVEDRIKNAEIEPTYLMAPVAIITTFRCFNMNPQKLEQLLHTFFGNSCLSIDVFDKEKKRHTPREWFIAPLNVIEQAIEFIISGEIVDYKYDSRRREIIGRK